MKIKGKMIARILIPVILVFIWVFAVLFTTVAFVSIGCASSTLPEEELSPANIDTGVKSILPIENVKSNLTGTQKKLSTNLLQLLDGDFLPRGQDKETLKKEMENLGQFRPAGSVYPKADGSLTDDLVYVYVYLKPHERTQTIESYVRDYVREVTDVDEENHLAVAWVEVKQLESLAYRKEVRTIRTVMPPLVMTGSVTTEGDTIHRTSDVRATYSQNGSGVKVGIISDGVNSWESARDSGDLPADLTVLSNTIGGDEGTAMLEIVHDMVPDAVLYFHDCGANTVAFNAAIDALVAAKCDVICDDIGWITEPFFEDGIVASHLTSVLASNDIIYVSSAGNAGRTHYQGDYYPISEITQHDFSHGTSESYPYLYLNMTAGSSVRIVLQWNDQFGSSGNDYDLGLWSYGSESYVAVSADTQNGDDNPLEWFWYTATAATAGDFAIVVDKYSGVGKTLEVFIYPRNGAWVYTNNINSSDSIFGHAAVPNAIAVGAIAARDPGNDNIELFSSQGPVTIRYPSPVTRPKPDLCGIDGVTVTGAGGFPSPFYGTSAAAPHIAAIAAQLMGAFPSATVNDVRNCLYSTAVDLEDPGHDYVFGYGRADAFEAYQSCAGDFIADHVVISEVYVDAFDDTGSEWVELYNPTGSEVSISGWKIDTATYQSDATLPSGAKIPSYGFYLIGDAGWTPDNSIWPTPDYYETITLTNTDGWIQLKNSTGVVIDTVGWGSATVNETLAYPDNPPENESLQRKVNATINYQYPYGPAWDSDDNSADFFIQDSPNPTNSTISSADPMPPIPELSTLILFSTGLITLAGYVLLTRRRK